MGASYRTYAFLHARLGAMKAELISPGQWQQLLSLETFPEHQRVLEATPYAPWLRATCEETVGRLRNAIYPVARKLRRSLPAAAARFLDAWIRRDLLRNLKTILNGKALQRSEEQIRRELLELDPMFTLPVDALLACPDVESAFDLLQQRTSLKHWIQAVRRSYRREPSLFGLNAALDRQYYPEVCRQLRHLGASDRDAVWPLLRLELDQVNLVWLLRYRIHYGLSPAETYYLLVPVTGQIGGQQLKNLVRESSLESILGRVKPRRLNAVVSSCETVGQVEVALWRHRARLARRMITSAAYTLGEPLALLVLKVLEVRDLVALLSGRALGAARAEIEAQLLGVDAGTG